MVFFNYRHIVSIFLLWVFLFPVIVKIEHHHEPKVQNLKHEFGIQSQEDNCAICVYEFSNFSNQFDTFVQTQKIHFNTLLCNCITCFYSNISLLLNSLRAPPSLSLFIENNL